MALPHLITQNELKWLFESTEITSQKRERDTCLLAMFVGTPCFVLELNRIQICDVLEKSGKIKGSFNVRGDTAFNGEQKQVFIKNKEIKQFIFEYLHWRLDNNLGLGDHPDYYMGLDPDSQLFDFAITHKDKGDKRTYAASSLGRHIKKLLKDGAIEDPSVLSGRRTFAVTLQKKGVDIAHIHHLLGNKTLETTKKLLITNTVDMGAIAAQAY